MKLESQVAIGSAFQAERAREMRKQGEMGAGLRRFYSFSKYTLSTSRPGPY